MLMCTYIILKFNMKEKIQLKKCNVAFPTCSEFRSWIIKSIFPLVFGHPLLISLTVCFTERFRPVQRPLMAVCVFERAEVNWLMETRCTLIGSCPGESVECDWPIDTGQWDLNYLGHETLTIIQFQIEKRKDKRRERLCVVVGSVWDL